jgi:hypothetical protein
MKYFLYLILRFITLFFISILIIVGLTFYFVKNQGIKIDEKVNILVLGDSHTQCAINDQVFNRAVNFSESGSTYFYSLIKLKEIVRTNKQIDTLILSFHFGSLDVENETQYLYNENYNFERLPKFLPFFNYDDALHYYDKILLIKSFLNAPTHYSTFILNGLIKGKFSTSDMKLGKFSNSERAKLLEDIQKRKITDQFKSKNSYSKIELNYLNEISDVCKQNGINLILINTPVFEAGKYTDTTFYNKFKESYSQQFCFLDLNLLDPDQDGFGDISHLNLKGSLKFTKELELIFANKKSLINKSN